MAARVPQCGTCGATFESVEDARRHYTSELHIHNVRLRVEGRRPLTAQEFRHVCSEAEDTVDGGGCPSFACKLCKKTFRSVQTLQSHVRSTAHLIKKEQRILARESDTATVLTNISASVAIGLHRRHNNKRLKGSVHMPSRVGSKVPMDDREEDASEVRCFLCGALAESAKENIAHLAKVHEFTIPLRDKCADPEGLVAYLARKINGLVCLVCGERTKSFVSLEALRAHMREKNHERIILGPEYEEFYTISLADADIGERLDLGSNELVLGNRRRCVHKREYEVPRPRKKEGGEAAEKHRALLASEQEMKLAVRREQREVMRPYNNELKRLTRQQAAHFHDLQLQVNLRSNKLHPKGYDGEGKLN
ncbi:putative C2H2 type zinc finger putative of C2H2 type C2H2 type zinc finger (2 copies) [Trypanosoma vivax]|nr:hypothetical protein TRVL_03075 [Trypanosoma vivax]KAH8614013.1 putative C2H2 type zinc finger putative of C2H2 type C2H2 type zinc finger (2 copies) [Trypanosoma vivax]